MIKRLITIFNNYMTINEWIKVLILVLLTVLFKLVDFRNHLIHINRQLKDVLSSISPYCIDCFSRDSATIYTLSKEWILIGIFLVIVLFQVNLLVKFIKKNNKFTLILVDKNKTHTLWPFESFFNFMYTIILFCVIGCIFYILYDIFWLLEERFYIKHLIYTGIDMQMSRKMAVIFWNTFIIVDLELLYGLWYMFCFFNLYPLCLYTWNKINILLHMEEESK